MEERKKRIKNIRRIRSITKSIIRNITRRDRPLQILRIHYQVLIKVRFPLVINAIKDQEAETVIIDQGLHQMREDTEKMILVIEGKDIIHVREEETQEKEVQRFLMVKI